MSGPDRKDDGYDHDGCLRAREEAAVNLLGHEEPSPTVRAHLAACPPCHDEYRELAALAPLLESGREQHRTPPGPGPDPRILERLLVEVGRRRRRRRTLVGAALAAAVLAAVLPLVPRLHDRAPTGPTAGARASVAPSAVLGEAVAVGSGVSGTGGARAQVWVRPHGSGGSEVTVSVHGVPVGHHCRMVVLDTSGAASDGGTWAVERPDSSYTEEVAAEPGRIARIELVDDGTGAPLIDVPVHAPDP